MADYTTFADMKNRVRDGLADHTDTFFTSTEIGVAINEGQWEIYKILHGANVGFFFNLTPETITLLPSTNYYTLVNQLAWIDEIIADQNGVDNQVMFYYKDRHDQGFRDLLNLSTNQLFVNAGVYYYDVVNDKTLCIVPRPVSQFNVTVYTVQDPPEMSADGDLPSLKVIFRPLVVEYAVRKLKNKEETGEYLSHDKLLAFLLDNTSKYIKPRGGTNQLTVEEY